MSLPNLSLLATEGVSASATRPKARPSVDEVKSAFARLTSKEVVQIISKRKKLLIQGLDDRMKAALPDAPRSAMRVKKLEVAYVRDKRTGVAQDEVEVTLELTKICTMARAWERDARDSPEVANSKLRKTAVAAARASACAALGETKLVRGIVSWRAEPDGVYVSMRKVRGGLLAAASSAVFAFSRAIGVLPLRIDYDDISEEIIELVL